MQHSRSAPDPAHRRHPAWPDDLVSPELPTRNGWTLDNVGSTLTERVLTRKRKWFPMARIKKFVVGDREVKPPQSAVDGYIQKVVDEEGEVYLYLYNYAEGGPKPGSSPTQSIHLDYTTAKAFKAIIDEVFESFRAD